MNKTVTYISRKPHKFPNTVDFGKGRELVAAFYAKCANQFNYCLAVDTETNGLDELVNDVLLVGLGTPDEQIIIDTCTIHLTEILPDDYRDYYYIAHNMIFDGAMCYTNFGIMFENVYCTSVADRRLYQNSRHLYDYWTVRKRHLGVGVTVTDEQKSFIGQSKYKFSPSISQIYYLADDVEYLIPIKDSQVALLKEYGMYDYVRNTLMPLIPAVIEMQVEGIEIDDKKFIDYTETVERELYDIQCELDNLVIKYRDELPTAKRHLLIGGKYTHKRRYTPIKRTNSLFGDITYGEYIGDKDAINWGSGVQISDVFARLGIPLPTKDDKALVPSIGDSYDNLHDEDYIPKGKVNKNLGVAKTINDVFDIEVDETFHHGGWTIAAKKIDKFVLEHHGTPSAEILELVVQHSKLKKYVTTYGYTILAKRNAKTGKLHSTFRVGHTGNFRLSSGGGKDSGKKSTKPNFQNFPRNNNFRNCVIAPPGYAIQTTDYSGAEVVIICDKTNDQKLYELAVIKDDAHSPIITNSWKHVHLYRACKLAGVIHDLGEYEKTWQYYAREGFIGCGDLVNEHYNLYLNFYIDKQHNFPYRQAGKNVTFGSIYNMKERTAQATINGTTKELRKIDPHAESVSVTLEEAGVMLWAIKQFIPVTFKYMDQVVSKAFLDGYLLLNSRSNGRVWFHDAIDAISACNLTIQEYVERGADITEFEYGYYKGYYNVYRNGRRTGDKFKLDKDIVNEIDGQARNIVISGTQADMISEAMVVLRGVIKDHKLPHVLLLQVHDELVHKIPGDYDIRTIPTIRNDKYGIYWDEAPFINFVPYVMTEVANRYLVNVTMKASTEVKPYWTK